MKIGSRRDPLDLQAMKYAVVDIEATGPDITGGDRIIQIAAIIYENNEKINEYEMLINPEIAIPPQISQLTGIDQQEVINAPKIVSVIQLWYERLKDCIFIGHNLAFDLRIMKEVFSEHALIFDPLAIDTFLLSKIIYPMSDGYGLSDLADYLEIELKNAHNALADARFTSVLVNRMAESIALLPSQLRNKLRDLAQYLPNDEKLLLEYPMMFVNHEQMESTQNEIMHRETTEHDELLVDYIIEQWYQNPHLVIENTDAPLKEALLYLLAQKMSIETPLVIVVQNETHMQQWQDFLQLQIESEILTLKTKNNYLNGQLLEEIEEKVSPAKLNQTELITWMAMIHYYHLNKSSDLTLINKELKMFELLHKLAKELKVDIPLNIVYDRQVQSIKHSPITIMSMGTFLHLYQNSKITELFPESATIFFEDAKYLLEIGLWFQQKTIDISQMMTELQDILDEHFKYSHDYSNQNMIATLNHMTTQIHQLILHLEEQAIDGSRQSGKRTFYISKDDADFLAMLENLLHLNQQLINDQRFNFDKKTLLQNINKLSVINDLLIQDKSEHYWTFTGEVLNQKLYHVQITLNRISWPHDFWTNLSNDFRYLLVSPGNYHYKEEFGIYNRLGGPNGYYLKIKDKPQSHITFQIPVLYLTEFISENNKVTFISNMKAMIQEQKANSYLILISNQEDLLHYYQVFMDDQELLNQYLVQIRGSHGSVRRMINRVKNEKKFILIMTINDLQSAHIANLPNNLTVLLEKLPFLSPDKPELLAISESIQDERLVFDSMNLPMMVQRMKYLVMILGNSHEYFLFDDRVYTRTYSKRLQEMLAPFIQFEWKMNDHT